MEASDSHIPIIFDCSIIRDLLSSASQSCFEPPIFPLPSNSEEKQKSTYDDYQESPTVRAVFDQSKLPLDSRVIHMPLNEQEHKCWEQFLMVDKGNPSIINNVSKMTLVPARTVELDHPFAPVVYEFALSAFNELYQMYVKKGVPQNIYEADIKDVKYSNLHSGQLFYITLEAIEEDVVGVYEARVLCSPVDGRRSLIKFVRSPGSPIGRKLKGMANLIRMKKRYKALKDEKKDIKAELKKTRRKAMKGKQKAEEESPDELICLKEDYKAVKDVCRLLRRQIQELEPSDWEIKTTNLDDWCVPDKITGLQQRSGEHPCGGYDYINPLKVFSMVSGNYKPGKPLDLDPNGVFRSIVV